MTRAARDAVGLHQQHARGWWADARKHARVSRQLLVDLVPGEHGIHARSDGAKPVHRPKSLHQHHGPRAPAGVSGPGRRHSRRVSISRFPSDHQQMRQLSSRGGAGIVLPVAVADLVARGLELLRYTIAFRAGSHDEKGSRSGDNRFRARGGELLLCPTDGRHEAFHEPLQPPGVLGRRMLGEPPLRLPRDRAELQKTIGPAGARQTVQLTPERGRGLGCPGAHSCHVCSQLIQSSRHPAQVFALELLERLVDGITHGMGQCENDRGRVGRRPRRPVTCSSDPGHRCLDAIQPPRSRRPLSR